MIGLVVYGGHQHTRDGQFNVVLDINGVEGRENSRFVSCPRTERIEQEKRSGVCEWGYAKNGQRAGLLYSWLGFGGNYCMGGVLVALRAASLLPVLGEILEMGKGKGVMHEEIVGLL